MPQAYTGTATTPWRKLVVATAVVLTLLAFHQVLSDGAAWFAVIALLYAAGTLLTAHGRLAGLALLTLPSLAIAVAGGRDLLASGMQPGAYDGLAAYLLAVVAAPAAVLNLVGVAVELARRR